MTHARDYEAEAVAAIARAEAYEEIADMLTTKGPAAVMFYLGVFSQCDRKLAENLRKRNRELAH